MDKEKILEIARRYTVPELRQESTTDESVVWPMTYWEFCEEELLAFAQSVLEAERERIKEIIEQVGVQGNHNEWFDCVDVILERIK